MIGAMKATRVRPVRVGGVAGVILAGGRGRRLFPDNEEGGDKAQVRLAGKPLLAHVVARFAPQVVTCAINANAQSPALRRLGLPVIGDGTGGIGGGEFLGPLAGILAGMDWAKRTAPYCAWLASVPVDAPFVPLDLVARLAGEMQAHEYDVAVVRARNRAHFVTAMWSLNLAPALRQAVGAGGVRKVEDFLARHKLGYLDWPARGPDPFLNINTPADLRRAEARVAALTRASRPTRARPRRR